MDVGQVDLTRPSIQFLKIILQLLVLLGTHLLFLTFLIEYVLCLLSAALVEVKYLVGEAQIPSQRVLCQVAYVEAQQYSLTTVAYHLRDVSLLNNWFGISLYLYLHAFLPKDIQLRHQYNIAVLLRLGTGGQQSAHTAHIALNGYFPAHLQ